MPAITKIRAQLFFARSLRQVPDLARVLDVLGADDLMAPQRWGPAPGIHDPFDRATVLAFASAKSADEFRLRLHRNRPLETRVACYEGAAALGAMSIEMLGTIDPALAAGRFAAIDRLATCLPLEFGIVDLRFTEVAAKSHAFSGGGLHIASYVANGPPTVFPRTYFGHRVVEILGAALGGSGGVAHELDGGVVALDLIDSPWTATPEELARARVRIDRALRLVGTLARPAGGSRTIPGPRWVPPQPLGDLWQGSHAIPAKARDTLGMDGSLGIDRRPARR